MAGVCWLEGEQDRVAVKWELETVQETPPKACERAQKPDVSPPSFLSSSLHPSGWPAGRERRFLVRQARARRGGKRSRSQSMRCERPPDRAACGRVGPQSRLGSIPGDPEQEAGAWLLLITDTKHVAEGTEQLQSLCSKCTY